MRKSRDATNLRNGWNVLTKKGNKTTEPFYNNKNICFILAQIRRITKEINLIKQVHVTIL